MRCREFIGEPEKEIGQSKPANIIYESGQVAAFFISPRGELIDCGSRTHIDMIIKYPDKFGLTPQYIEDKYEEFGEKLGVEGTARSQIIIQLIKEGWVRRIRYSNKFWTIDVNKLDKKMKDRIYDWSKKMLDGTGGYKEQDKYMPVKILQLKRGIKPIEYPILKLSNDILFNESIGNRSRYIVILKDIKDISNNKLIV